MSAPAGSCKRSRADLEPEGAPAEADAATASTEPSQSLLEKLRVKVDALEVELATNRRFTTQAQQFVDHKVANMKVPADCSLLGIPNPGSQTTLTNSHQHRSRLVKKE
jgi:hypothetical protein